MAFGNPPSQQSWLLRPFKNNESPLTSFGDLGFPANTTRGTGLLDYGMCLIWDVLNRPMTTGDTNAGAATAGDFWGTTGPANPSAFQTGYHAIASRTGTLHELVAGAVWTQPCVGYSGWTPQKYTPAWTDAGGDDFIAAPFEKRSADGGVGLLLCYGYHPQVLTVWETAGVNYPAVRSVLCASDTGANGVGRFRSQSLTSAAIARWAYRIAGYTLSISTTTSIAGTAAGSQIFGYAQAFLRLA